MEEAAVEYEPRYLGGIVCFNDRDFFEAHEVWEGLWMHCAGPERKFYQALIQAAVALYHYGYGNFRGAVKLYGSSRDYMRSYGDRYLGLDIPAFWAQMARCFQPILDQPAPDAGVRPDEGLIPTIVLDPPPEQWPDPAEFESDEE